MKAIFCSQHYNDLPSLEEANGALNFSHHKDAFFKKAKEITCRYNLEEHIGFRLIHTHFQLKKKEIAVESFQRKNKVPSLVTTAQSQEEALRNGALPSSWIFREDENAYVFETSQDSAIRPSLELLKNHPTYFIEIRNELKKHALNEVLALSILKRNSLKRHHDEIYLDLHFNETESTLQLRSRSDALSLPTIATSWGFKNSHLEITAACARHDTKITL